MIQPIDTDLFKYRSKDVFINIFTLSPSGKFYYKVQKPVSINMSNFACMIIFYQIDGTILYHRNNVFAHWLEPRNQVNVVQWSKHGNMAYIYDYQRNNIYDSVFLHLRDKISYSIDDLKDNLQIVKVLNLADSFYDEEHVINTLQALGIPQQNLYTDEG